MDIDLLIVGGGIAGLWLLDEARRAGYRALLVESRALGSGQTIASQGILHGGFKHALGGRVSPFVDALKDMPPVWRDCLSGKREPDLREVRLRAAFCLCWRTGSFVSTLGQLGARLALKVDLHRLAESERPLPLAGCPGDVYRLDEHVIDPSSLINVLAERNRQQLIQIAAVRFDRSAPGVITSVNICDPSQASSVILRPRQVVLTAGEGNAGLREQCGLSTDVMRRLPLSILMIRGHLPDLNGFCLKGTKAQAVVTTQRVHAHEAVWQVASECIAAPYEDPAAFQAEMLNELRDALPGFAWPTVRIGSYVANRAEGPMVSGARSSDVQILAEGNVITAWPTKLVLAPRLAERVLRILPVPNGGSDTASSFADWPRPRVAEYPWDVSR